MKTKAQEMIERDGSVIRLTRESLKGLLAQEALRFRRLAAEKALKVVADPEPCLKDRELIKEHLIRSETFATAASLIV